MKPYNAFGRVPPSVPASQPVRYWDQALLVSVVVFWLSFSACLIIVHAVVGAGPLLNTLAVGTNVPFWILTFGGGDYGETIRDYAGSLAHPLLFKAGLVLAFALSALVSLFLGHRAARPRSSQFHIRGAELKRGEEARIEAQQITVRQSFPLGTVKVRLGNDLVLAKKTLSRHVIVSGSVGSGKTVLLHNFVHAFVHHRTAKALIYDVKGDFTAIYSSCPIVGVEDERGRCVPLGKVLRTKKQAAIFMQSVIPDCDGSGGSKFFDNTARLVGIGVIMSLIHVYKETWGARELAILMNQEAPTLAKLFAEHYQKAAQALGDPTAKTAQDIMATVASYTRIFDELSVAWGPYVYDSNMEPRIDPMTMKPLLRKEWNPLDWVRDDYTDKRCIILQGGGDKHITKGFISAIINLITPEIVSPALPDNEEGRCLAFVLDEMPTIGRINDFETLAVAGRSKGVVMVLAYQSISQMKALYGSEMTATIESTVYTKLICQQQMGETRDHIAKAFSTRIIGSVSHVDGKVHEEGKAVVYPDELTTELGFRKGEEYGREQWGIKFIAAVGEHNPLVLTCPGKTRKAHRPGRVAGAWTKEGFVDPKIPAKQTEHEQPVSTKSPGKRSIDEDEVEARLEQAKPGQAKPKTSAAKQYVGMIRDDM